MTAVKMVFVLDLWEGTFLGVGSCQQERYVSGTLRSTADYREEGSVPEHLSLSCQIQCL